MGNRRTLPKANGSNKSQGDISLLDNAIKCEKKFNLYSFLEDGDFTPNEEWDIDFDDCSN